MVTFAAFVPPLDEDYGHGGARYIPDDEDGMDIDFDDEDFASGNKLTCPGEPLTSSHTFMRGHGTYVENEEVISSVAGTIERVNKLISVRAIRTRYNPEVGDLVVGRITEVQPRRWKVDAGSRQDAVLMLSSVNLPGGVQRRKLESDELQMRTFFEEGDLLVAEVQAFFADGAMSLHTRSLRYGKLRNGQLVVVPPALIRRLKSHFTSLPCGVDLILGLNGYIWVSKHVKTSEQEGEEGFDAEAVYSNRNDDIDDATRTAISRVSNIIRVLAAHFTPLTDTILLDAYEWAVEQDCDVKDLLQDDIGAALVAAVPGLREIRLKRLTGECRIRVSFLFVQLTSIGSSAEQFSFEVSAYALVAHPTRSMKSTSKYLESIPSSKLSSPVEQHEYHIESGSISPGVCSVHREER